MQGLVNFMLQNNREREFKETAPILPLSLFERGHSGYPSVGVSVIGRLLLSSMKVKRHSFPSGRGFSGRGSTPPLRGRQRYFATGRGSTSPSHRRQRYSATGRGSTPPLRGRQRYSATGRGSTLPSHRRQRYFCGGGVYPRPAYPSSSWVQKYSIVFAPAMQTLTRRSVAGYSLPGQAGGEKYLSEMSMAEQPVRPCKKLYSRFVTGQGGNT